MRRRRQIEVERGYEQVRGTFAQVISSAAAAESPADELRSCWTILRVRPVITAHPTEAKRVTVLEKHRRIYRRLVDLESPRWTPRERQALIEGLQDEIELLWMTGELRLAKPTVPQEVFWGLHFFNETLFEAVPDLLDKLERALAQFYPGESFQVPPFFQFGSWVGGDRDGNPFVTNEVTRGTLLENRLTGAPALPPPAGGTGPGAQHHRARRCRCSERFRAALERELAASGEGEEIAARNPGEVFRQYLACMVRRLDVMVHRRRAGQIGTGPARLRLAPTRLIADLRLIEDALSRRRERLAGRDAGAAGSAGGGVVPLQHHAARPAGEHHQAHARRWHDAVARRQRRTGDPPEVTATRGARGSWRSWRGRCRRTPAAGTAAGAAETLGMFRLVRSCATRWTARRSAPSCSA